MPVNVHFSCMFVCCLPILFFIFIYNNSCAFLVLLFNLILVIIFVCLGYHLSAQEELFIYFCFIYLFIYRVFEHDQYRLMQTNIGHTDSVRSILHIPERNQVINIIPKKNFACYISTYKCFHVLNCFTKLTHLSKKWNIGYLNVQHN